MISVIRRVVAYLGPLWLWQIHADGPWKLILFRTRLWQQHSTTVVVIPREFGLWFWLLGGTVNESSRKLQALNAHQMQMGERSCIYLIRFHQNKKSQNIIQEYFPQINFWQKTELSTAGGRKKNMFIKRCFLKRQQGCYQGKHKEEQI